MGRVVVRPGRSLRDWLRPGELPPGVPRGLGSWASETTLGLSVLISFAVLRGLGEHTTTAAWVPIVQLVVAAPLTTGFLVVAATVVAILFACATNVQGARTYVAPRSARFFGFIAGSAVFLATLVRTADWMRTSGPQPPSTYTLWDFLIVLLEAALISTAFFFLLWLMFAFYSVLSMFTLDRASSQAIHPILAPLVDAQISMLGLATTVPTLIRGGRAASAMVGCISSVVVGVFAVVNYGAMARESRH